jgi:hypothetical protein
VSLINRVFVCKKSSDVNARVLKWNEETVEKEQCVHFLEEVVQNQQSTGINSVSEVDISYDAVKKYTYYSENSHKKCMEYMLETSQASASAGEGSDAVETMTEETTEATGEEGSDQAATKVNLQAVKDAQTAIRSDIKHFK